MDENDMFIFSINYTHTVIQMFKKEVRHRKSKEVPEDFSK